MELFIISGASGSGKTAILQNLKKQLPSSFSVYDFDDIGVPKNANKNGDKNQPRNGYKNCF